MQTQSPQTGWNGLSNSVKIVLIIVIAIVGLAILGWWQERHTEVSCTRGYGGSVTCTEDH